LRLIKEVTAEVFIRSRTVRAYVLTTARGSFRCHLTRPNLTTGLLRANSFLRSFFSESCAMLLPQSTLRVNFDYMGIRIGSEREARNAMNLLFGRKRRWRPTPRWESAMQRNLARAPSKQHPEESQQIKEAVYEWGEQDPRTRPTQEEMARRLCNLLGRDKLSKQYINRLVNGLPSRHSEAPLNRRYSLHVPRGESEGQVPPRQAEPSPPPEPVLSVEEFREKLREKYYAERPWLRNLRK